MTTRGAVDQIGPGNGRLLVRTSRTGAGARFGHDLLIEATRWSGEIDLGGADPSAARVRVQVDLDSLTVRDGTGGAIALSAAQCGEIDATMRRILAPPSVATFVSTKVTPVGTGGHVDGTLTVHGTQRPLRLIVGRVGEKRFQCRTTVIQSDFGIRPYSAMLGALRVRDEVEVEIDLVVDVDVGTTG